MTVPASPSEPPAALEAVLDEWLRAQPYVVDATGTGPFTWAALLDLMQRAEQIGFDKAIALRDAAALKVCYAVLALIAEERAKCDSGYLIGALDILSERVQALEIPVPSRAPLTLAELEALPVKSIVLDDTGTPWYLGAGGLWWIVASLNGHTTEELFSLGPVVLLFRGGAE